MEQPRRTIKGGGRLLSCLGQITSDNICHIKSNIYEIYLIYLVITLGNSQSPPMHANGSRPANQLPDPWLFDSEALLRELDRCRELILQIPITNPNATHFGMHIAVQAIWTL